LSTSESTVGPRPGLSNVVDIVIAPNAAFARLREVPTWGWAYLVVVLLGVAGALLYIPALIHTVDATLPAKLASVPQVAKLPPDQQQRVIAAQVGVTRTIFQLFWVFVPIQALLVPLLQSVVMLIPNAVSGGDGTFKKYFALSMNVQVIGYGLLSLVLGLIVVIRGASSFEEQSAVTSSAPSLALLMPGVKGFLAGFLGTLNVFALWSTALLALGMQRVGRIAAAAAWVTSIVMLLLAACLAGWGAAQSG
jgi:hypothetical protein